MSGPEHKEGKAHEAGALERGASVGRFVVLETVSVSPEESVYAAFDPDLNRRVRLSVVRPASAEQTEALLEQAKAAARISHPKLRAVFDLGRLGESVFVATEWLAGATARDHVHAKPRSWRELRTLAADAGEGLEALRTESSLRYTPTLDSVWVGEDGRVRLTGFERWHAAESGAVHVGDLHALGAMLHEASYGEPPIDGVTALPTMTNQGRHLPRRLRRLISTALAAPATHAGSRTQALPLWVRELRRDPKLTRERLIRWGPLVFLGCLLVALVARLRVSETERCARAGQEGADVWSAAQRDHAYASFLTTKIPFADRAFQEVDGLLRRYLEDWRQSRQAVCLASGGSAPGTTASLEVLQIACLNERLEEARVLGTLLTRADTALVQRSNDIVRTLRPNAPCRDAAYVLSRLKAPDTETQRRGVEAMRLKLARSRALLGSAQYAEGLALLTREEAAIDALGYTPLKAEAWLLRGKFEDALTKPEAQESLSKAIFQAELSHHDEVAADAAIALMNGLQNRNAYEQADFWSFFAEAFTDRRPDTDASHGAYLEVLSKMLSDRLKLPESLQASEAALEARKKQQPQNPLAIASALSRLSTSLSRLEQPDLSRAAEAAQKAKELRENQLGREHPEVAFAAGNLGIIQGLLGDNRSSEQSHRFTREVMLRVFGEDSPMVARANLNLSETLVLLGSFAEGEVLARDAGRIFALNTKDEAKFTPLVADVHAVIAAAAVGEQRWNVAETEALASIGLFEKSLGPTASHLVRPLLALGEAELARGRCVAAVPPLERALSLPARKAVQPVLLSRCEFSLARCLAEEKPAEASLVRARELVVSARDRLAGLNVEPAFRATLDAWLVEHAAP